MAKWDAETTITGWADYRTTSGFVPWSWLYNEPTANKAHRPAFAFFWWIRTAATPAVPWDEPPPLDRPTCPRCDLPLAELDHDKMDYLCLACGTFFP